MRAWAAFAACLARAAGAGAPPNIVFILADDQGWGDVGYNDVAYQHPAYEYEWTPNPPRTPHLDAMAASEHTLVFRRFYAGSSVCSPTRAALLTGRSPARECVEDAEGCGTLPAWACVEPVPLSPRTFTAAEAARGAGLATLHAGKWHLGDFFPKDNPNPSPAYLKWPVSRRAGRAASRPRRARAARARARRVPPRRALVAPSLFC